MKHKVLIVVGPTASGKSALGVELARRFNGEVVSADSRQVYRGLDKGTGKVTRREMKGVPHHMLDVASPKRPYSAGDYAKRARAAVEDILARGRLPIVVGGTGFYIDALLGRIALPEVPPDPVLRRKLDKKSAAQLFATLQKRDPKRAAKMDNPSERNNKVRLIRALEIAYSPRRSDDAPMRQYDAFWIGIAPKDTVLRTRINKRLHDRLRGGMVNEAKRLHATGLSYKRMQELGLEYRSLARYLAGETSRAEMERELQSDIWRYARKQIGYWKRNRSIKWFHPSHKNTPLIADVRKWAKRSNGRTKVA